MNPPSWYKWVILFTTCFSTFACYGYIASNTSITTIYYIAHYNERIVSGLIGSTQYGLFAASCLPALYLSRKIGNLPQQLIGAVIFSGSIALTSLTVSSWQGLLLSGVCLGIGGGLMQIATTNVIKQYFPGRQVAPFGAICLTLNAAAMAVPQLWESLMTALGWTNTLLVIGGMLLVNVLCGFSYIKPGDNAFEESAKERKPKLSLIPRRSSSTVFIVSQEDLQIAETTATERKLSETPEEFDTQKPVESATPDENGNEKLDVEDAVEKPNSNQNGMRATMTQPQAIAMVVMSGIYSGGIISCFTVMGDYARKYLSMSEESVANALTVQGAMQIVSSLMYIFLTVCTEFSPVTLHAVCMFGLASASLALAFIRTEVDYYVVVGVLGLCKAITTGNAFPLSLELTNPEQAMNLYVVKNLVDGVSMIAMPFAAVYIQETVNEHAALYISSAALFCAAFILVPFVRRYLLKPRVKSENQVSSDDVKFLKYYNYY